MAVTRIKNNQITDSTIVANAKIQNYTVTSTLLANNLTYGSDLTVTGNLTVQGQTTTIDTNVTTIEDPVILLASTQSGSPTVDIGFIGERGTSDNIAFVWDESATEFVTAFTSTGETNTTITISSYANFHTNNANIGGNIVINGTTSLVGNLTGNLNVTGNIAGGNVLTPGLIDATGNITGGNLITAGLASVTGNITGGNLTTTGKANIGTLEVTGTGAVTGNLTVTANVSGGNLITAGLGSFGTTVTATGNITGGNLNTAGKVAVTGNVETGANLVVSGYANVTGNVNGTGAVFSGNVTASTFIGNISGNIDAGGANTNIQFNDGDILAGSAAFTFDKTSNAVVASGNITGGNITTAGKANIGTLEVTGTGAVTGNLTVTANVSGGNLITAGLVSAATVTATGNVTGGNLITGGLASVTGNVTGGNLITAGLVSATGNVAGGNITTAGRVDATGNVTGGNLVTVGLTNTGTLQVAGNAIVDGNLTVNGNLTYINIDDLRVQDPIIVLGTGPNGAPLTTNDGLDRGVFMEYYTTGLGNAFVGWDNSTGNMVIASDAYFTANDVVGVNSYGTLQAGNLYVQSLLSVGNVTGGNLITGGLASVTGNITGGNLVTGGLASVTGNITGGNLNTGGTINATGNINGTGAVFSGNVTADTFFGNISGNIDAGGANTNIQFNDGDVLAGSAAFTFDKTSNAVTASGNVTGGNLLTGGLVTATGNVTGGNLITAGLVSAATVTATGNVTGGNLITAGLASVTGNITGGNINTAGKVAATGNLETGANVVATGYASVTGNITGGNLITAGLASVTGNVTGGNLNTAGQVVATGNVTGGNVVATALVTGANVTASANVTGANVVGTTSGKFGNIVITGDDITDTNGRVNFNTAGADVDFAVNGDTVANVFYVDAGTGTVSFGSATQTTGAIVAFNATNSVLMPVGNTGTRPGTGVTGMMRFNTTNNNLEVYDNSEWAAVGVPSFTVITNDSFAGDGSTVAFTLSESATTDSVIVSINGVVQIPTTAYSVSGTTLTFTEAPLTGDAIDVRILTTTTTVTEISNASGNAVVGTIDTEPTVQITGDLLPAANSTQSLGSSIKRWSNLWVSGSTITLGNVVMKNVAGGNTIGFYGPDGTTPATIAASSVDTTQIASGTSNAKVVSSGGNITMSVGGTSNVVVVATTGMSITGDLSVTGNATLSGNILGDRVQNGTTSFDIQTTNGNANITVGGTSNVAVFTTAGANVTGTLGVTGNITGGNLSGTSIVGTLTTAAQTNITSVGTLGSLSVTANVTAGNLSVGTGTISGGNIVNTNANGVGNIGSSVLYFNTVFAKATSAQYADLAEKYVADAAYAPGTVVIFGGDKEVTVSSTDADRAVAGVVSTNPSYIMNGTLEAEFVATVALTGRVPCRVTGTVRKGDLMVSAGYGLARAEQDPRVGTVIGKALENFEGNEGVIEVVVGRF